MIRFFPFDKPVFEHQFGIAALPAAQPILQTTDQYTQEIELRRQQLESRFRDTYLVDSDGKASHSNQTLRFLVDHCDHLSRHQDQFVNQLTGESIPIADADLHWLGRNVQEDVVVLSDDVQRGFPVLSGCVCFPSGWSIAEKLGQSVLAIHHDVPEFQTALYPATEKLMQRMKPGKTVWRTNWGVRPWSQLDQSPRHQAQLDLLAKQITPQNAGQRCYFRTEFQTLTRLPGSAIVFTILTQQCKLSELTDPQRDLLRGVLATCPESTLRYKGILPFLDALTNH
ncbi:DUF3445 domain-containing protein [Stieleria sp. TO1_6]|uniref:heme-dependent oxidative N-demethylase family protein n=1 Tax=Stieleria tagensis TaxID=2956795 RepID=UPI00209B4427|nr:DUF3445 domain-containing protein [Stieleria tagensis]MCO8124791.1 DUF3445 domain-containing protein [Stieleria tagensis]